MHDGVVLRPVDDEVAEQSALRAGEGVVDQDVAARHLSILKSTATAPPGGTVTVCTPAIGGEIRLAALIDRIEDLADHVEGRGEVRPADAEEDPHRLAHARARSGWRWASASTAPLKTKYSGFSAISFS